MANLCLSAVTTAKAGGLDSMSNKSRVAWREGMFLRPQHFQQQDRFLDALVNARLMAARPYAWGLTELVVDEDLATLGKFGVVRASGVMPDGTAFLSVATIVVVECDGGSTARFETKIDYAMPIPVDAKVSDEDREWMAQLLRPVSKV